MNNLPPATQEYEHSLRRKGSQGQNLQAEERGLLQEPDKVQSMSGKREHQREEDFKKERH